LAARPERHRVAASRARQPPPRVAARENVREHYVRVMNEEYVDSYEDVRRFSLSDEREQTLLDKQTECCFMWTAKKGDPAGAIMNFVVRDWRFWGTCTRQRQRA